uniref:Uncharacterized protein n=1 Tax=Tanacetum cinerariifolium TaxID=118510 RepID=A0A699I2I9_TANCI|nr:hypothetical protein [Tanacetum cinerariifolium]
MASYNHFGCSCYGSPFNGGNCPGYSSVGSEIEFVYDPNLNSFDNPLDFSYQSPQPQYETYSCELCGNDALWKFNRYSFFKTLKVLLLAWDRVFEIKDAFGNKQYKPEDIQELFRKNFNDVQNIHEELAKYINTPSWNIPIVYYDDDDDEDYTIAITLVLPTKEPTNSLIMGNEHLHTIPEKESNEFIKSSVKNLVPSPSESDDISNGECDFPFCDDFPRSHLVTFSNPLFDIDNDFTSSDDKSFSEEDVPMENFKVFSNLFLILMKKSFLPSDPFMKEIDLFLAFDGSIPPGIDSDSSDSEGDNLFPVRLLHDDPIPLPDILDFSNVIRVFLPFFTYPVTSSFLLSSGNEDMIFDPGISNNHFSSLETRVSHRSGTFMKFNVYPNHLNETPMETLSSTCFPMDQ